MTASTKIIGFASRPARSSLPPSRTRFDRETFVASRLTDFTSVKALIAIIGHPPERWALVVSKELADNGVDNAEVGAAPKIIVAVTDDTITVSDNGAGIDPEDVARVTNYTNRVSSTAAYVSPTRGQQGNALQAILAMPFALDGERGETIIESRGIRHSITFTMDELHRTPIITHHQGPGFVKNGSRITVRWPVSARSALEALKGHFLQMAEDYAVLNPHLSIRVDWYGDTVLNVKAADPTWPKWLPSDPTSAHWYDHERFDRLMAAMVARDRDNGRDRPVREFIAAFRGMTSTAAQKRVLDAIGAARMPLVSLAKDQAKRNFLRALLQEATKPVKPIQLGVIGREHLERACIEVGGDGDTIAYHRIVGTADGLPWVIEAAFALAVDPEAAVRFVLGCNWSPAITDPFNLRFVLTDQRLGEDDPIIVALHLASPLLPFTDQGKGTLRLPEELGDAVNAAIIKVTAAWAKQRKSEERDASAQARRQERLARRRLLSVKDAAYAVMEQAYFAARGSVEGAPANARQIMYQARPLTQAQTGKQLDDNYFTQTLLPDYMTEHALHGEWNVVFDERGHFIEPHTNHMIGLGTLAVLDYLDGRHKSAINNIALRDAHVLTRGPAGRFGALLYIEKEGFLPLFDHARIAERFDIAVLSSKGMPSTSARQLVEMICSEHDMPLLILHDFDKSGMSIAALFSRDNRRYQYERPFKAIDIGLRLADVHKERLLRFAENVFDRGDADARRENLRLNGATPEEIEFLLDRRVELNALPSDRFIRFVERKLKEHGIGKLVPNKPTLEATYRAMVRGERARPVIEKMLANAAKNRVAVPADLNKQVTDFLEQNPHCAWDTALAQIVRGQ